MQSLFDFLKEGTCAATVVRAMEKRLSQAGFRKLEYTRQWQLERGGSYYVTIRDTSCLAFRIAAHSAEKTTPYFRIVSAHTDQPCLKLKPLPEISGDGHSKLNISVYGGPIYSTWMDRPLSLAGRAVLAGRNVFDKITVAVDLKKPLLVVPNLAIHMNREVNKGVELNPQKDLQPFAGLNLDGAFVKEALGAELGVKPDQIVDYELYAYNCDEPVCTGFDGSLISSPRLDDLIMVHAALAAMVGSQPESGVTVLAALDSEEIGSRTPQGGASASVAMVLEKIASSLGESRTAFLDLLADSFMLSGDVAHALHPNREEMHDPVLRPVLGGGPVIKLDAGQRYMTSAADYPVYSELCRMEGVPVQVFVSRADKVSGSTLGPVMSAFLPCRIVDIGTPILSMHSARELASAADYEYTRRSFDAFYRL